MKFDLPIKPPVYLPLGMPRVDIYFIKVYLKIFFLVLIALLALISIGDISQKFDEFASYARQNDLSLVKTLELMTKYYLTFAPQLVLQYMLPLIILLAAVITITTTCINNEYTVLRSVGVSCKRTMIPLLIPALMIAITFQLTRDYFLPDMVRTSNNILQLIKPKSGTPVDITNVSNDIIQTIAIGTFDTKYYAHNIIIEKRKKDKYQRGNIAEGDNDFTAYTARTAQLVLKKDQSGYQWVPLDQGKIKTFTKFSRKIADWTEPIDTTITPAIIERQILGDGVSSWEDLQIIAKDNPEAKFEIYWRIVDPIACCILLLIGAGLAMGIMLKYSNMGYIQTIIIAILSAVAFYSLRLFGQDLWEQGVVSIQQAIIMPLALCLIIAIPVTIWLEK